MLQQTKESPDVRRLPYPTQRLHPGVQVLSVFGVCDQHRGPLLERQVREAEQVMVKSQNPVPGGGREKSALASDTTRREFAVSKYISGYLRTCGCPSSRPAPAPGCPGGVGCGGRASGRPVCAGGRTDTQRQTLTHTHTKKLKRRKCIYSNVTAFKYCNHLNNCLNVQGEIKTFHHSNANFLLEGKKTTGF